MSKVSRDFVVSHFTLQKPLKHLSLLFVMKFVEKNGHIIKKVIIEFDSK